LGCVGEPQGGAHRFTFHQQESRLPQPLFPEGRAHHLVRASAVFGISLCSTKAWIAATQVGSFSQITEAVAWFGDERRVRPLKARRKPKPSNEFGKNKVRFG